jgi:hypothetical protein
MDPVIKTYPARSLSDDLWITMMGGIAYQKDMSKSVPYDQAYFDKYVGYEGTPLAMGINESRISLTSDLCDCILDVGVGSGEFMSLFPKRSYGFDINDVAVEKLLQKNSFIDPYAQPIPDAIDGLTFWDTLEHMRRPSDILKKPRIGVYVFISMPIFTDLTLVAQSKHYRPDEHYYYYTEDGLKKFMNDLGYTHLETSDGETKAGREGILSFTFQRTQLADLDALAKNAVTPSFPIGPTADEKIVKPVASPTIAAQRIVAPPRGPQGFALTSKPAK